MTATDRFLHAAHVLTEPPTADLATLPSVYKRYPRTAAVALTSAHPLGRILRQVNGVTRARWATSTTAAGTGRSARRVAPGRPAPSAGARYPVEVYAATGPTAGLAAGLYHYDPAHHTLDRLRTGDGRGEVVDCLDEPPPVPPSLVLLLTTVFWRNSAKYGQFGYRLQTLDTGVIVAQVVATAEAAGLVATVHLRFADERLDALLGCDGDAEAVLAVVTLSPAAGALRDGGPATEWHLPPVRAESPATTLSDRPGFADLTALHRAARSARAADRTTADIPVDRAATSTADLVLPAAAPLDLAAGMARRRTVMGYHPVPMPVADLARLLAAAARTYRGDADPLPLCCFALHVDGVAPGPYRYDAARHRLRPTGPGRTTALAAAHDAGLREEFRNAALVVAPLGQFTDGQARYGDRWYRMQNVAAGALANRVCLGAAALGLDSHVNCGFDPRLVDVALGLSAGSLTSLVVITVGTARLDRTTLEVAL